LRPTAPRGLIITMSTHTPRLCIDGRAAAEFPSRALIAQELIDQLVAAGGEGQETSSDWIDKQRTVLLSHPGQIFSGQLRRFETKRRIGLSPLYWFWEKQFVKKANISVFHRFRPADRLGPSHNLPTLTTVLPGGSPRRSRAGKQKNHRFVVPSELDAKVLETRFKVSRDRIEIAAPSVRRYVHFTELPKDNMPGTVLFLVGSRSEKTNYKKLIPLIGNRFPNLRQKVIPLSRKHVFSPVKWMETLARTKYCFYLTDRAFDWPTLALEAFYWNIPCIYLGSHAALSEMISISSLELSRFLVNQPDPSALSIACHSARQQLENRGAFDALAMAKQFNRYYETLAGKSENVPTL